MDVHGCLNDPSRYEYQIERLHRRYLLSDRLDELKQDGVSLARIIQRRRKVARLLSHAVARGEYCSEPATLRRIKVEGKERVVFAYRVTDAIVHGVVAGLIEEQMAPRLSPGVCSYRPGLSWWSAVSAFARYARAHRKARPQPRTRGLYVLRRDVESYTDLIPVHPGSQIWPVVRDLLAPPGSKPVSDADWQLVETVIRPEVWIEDGLAMHTRGVPTGQPISNVLFNLYLDQLDHKLDQLEGGFYRRYSDDLFFAHPDPGVARRADELIDSVLAELELRVKPEKRQTFYLTGAGHASKSWPEARGTISVPMLGMRVSAEATVALSRNKLRRLLRDIEGRANRSVAQLAGADRDGRGRIVCMVINNALDPRPHAFQEASAVLLRRAVTDRRQLGQIDHLVARTVLRAVGSDGDVRAFRTTPYRTMREDWGLISVLHARNKYGK
jgi:hypothetical protein